MNASGKGLGSLLSFAILVTISIVAVSIALLSGKGTVDSAITSVDIKDAEGILSVINNRFAEVASEGNGSTRILFFTTSGNFEILPQDDTVIYSTQTEFYEYFSRFENGNIIYVNGNDVSCKKIDADLDGDVDLVMENSFVKFVLQYVNKSSPLSQIDTDSNILSAESKVAGSSITFANSSVVIDGNGSTSFGLGYSEILREGNNLPYCYAHFFIDATEDYDIYYRLYAGADFILGEVGLR